MNYIVWIFKKTKEFAKEMIHDKFGRWLLIDYILVSTVFVSLIYLRILIEWLPLFFIMGIVFMVSHAFYKGFENPE